MRESFADFSWWMIPPFEFCSGTQRRSRRAALAKRLPVFLLKRPVSRHLPEKEEGGRWLGRRGLEDLVAEGW